MNKFLKIVSDTLSDVTVEKKINVSTAETFNNWWHLKNAEIEGISNEMDFFSLRNWKNSRRNFQRNCRINYQWNFWRNKKKKSKKCIGKVALHEIIYQITKLSLNGCLKELLKQFPRKFPRKFPAEGSFFWEITKGVSKDLSILSDYSD